MKLVIIDYGMGNIKSIVSAFKYLGIDDITVSNKYKDIKSADKLLLPGVGSFSKAMENIKNLELDKTLEEVVLVNKKPILGICLGMQLLCKASEEDTGAMGLSFLDGEIKKFKDKNVKVPHVGFNQVKINSNSRLFNNIDNDSDFYFTHSYKLETNLQITQSYCNYSEPFVCAYEVDNIAATQFHPELSQRNGLNLLKNFIEKF
jgi:glutamine amidotransferase